MMARRGLIWKILVSLAVMQALSCGGKKARVTPEPVAHDQTPASRERSLDRPEASPATAPADSTLPSPTDSAPARARAGLAPSLAIVRTALDQIGIPYRWGGNTPGEGFDCSGLVQWTFAQHGIDLPRSTSELFEAGRAVPRGEVAPGDLIFYAWGKSADKVTHVGIYVGEGDYVHSPGTGRDVYRTAAFDRAHQRRFLGARRIVEVSHNRPESDDETPSEEPFITYTVRPGDYIWALARRYEVSPYRILKLNDLTLDSTLEIGQELLIPLADPR